MAMIFAYDHDPNYVPNADQLVLLDMIEEEFAGHGAHGGETLQASSRMRVRPPPSHASCE